MPIDRTRRNRHHAAPAAREGQVCLARSRETDYRLDREAPDPDRPSQNPEVVVSAEGDTPPSLKAILTLKYRDNPLEPAPNG
jgi:hypothetical protein